MQAIYSNNALPLLAWKPFENNTSVKDADDKLMQQVSAGKFDSQFVAFAKQITALNKPVFVNLFFNKNK